jgi:hypothetical protein
MKDSSRVFRAFSHTKKVDIGSFIGARLRILSGPRRPDPNKKRSGSATLLFNKRGRLRGWSMFGSSGLIEARTSCKFFN